MVTLLSILFCLPIIFISTTFAAASHLDPECLPPFLVYLIVTFIICIAVASIASFLLIVLQIADYLYVRITYRRHHPEYRNREIAALLCLS